MVTVDVGDSVSIKDAVAVPLREPSVSVPVPVASDFDALADAADPDADRETVGGRVSEAAGVADEGE